MFERYVEKARQAIVFSKYTADQFGSPEIDTDHILMALLEDAGLTECLLQDLSVKDIREEIRARASRPPMRLEPYDSRLTKDSKQALLFAVEEAHDLGHRHVGNEHILVGLLRVENCTAAQILQAKGLSADKVRSRITASNESK